MSSCVALLLLGGCVKSDVTRIGKTYPPRPADCEVETLSDWPPEFPHEKIGEAEIQCHSSEGREACVEKLRVAACELGAHAVHQLHEGFGDDYHVVAAYFARKTEVEDAQSPPTATGEQADAEAPEGAGDTPGEDTGEAAVPQAGD